MRRQGGGAAEKNAVHHVALMPQLQFEVFFAHQTLLQHLHVLVEQGGVETMPPDGLLQAGGDVGAAKFGRQSAVCLQRTLQGGCVQPFAGNLPERSFEYRKLVACNGAAGGGGVAAEFEQHARMALGQQIQGVAQMKTRNRTARSLEFMRLAGRAAGGKHEGRPMPCVLDARGHDAHYALVKPLVKYANGGRRHGVGIEQLAGQGQGMFAHAAFGVAPLAVDGVELLCERCGMGRVVAEQEFDAEPHIGQPSGGVDARPQGKAQIERGSGLYRTPGHGKQGGHACRLLAAPDALQALRHQAPVVGVEPHHIGHGAQGHQRQQGVQPGLFLGRKSASAAQFAAQCQQHVKHHAYAGQVLACERAVGQIGIDQRVGSRQCIPRQMVVGDDDLQAQRLCVAHAFHTGNTVVHREKQLCAQGVHAVGNGGGQAIAIAYAVGHQIAGLLCTEQAQAAQRNGAGRGTVAVVIGNHADVPVGGNGVCQQVRRLFGPGQIARRQQMGQVIVNLCCAGDAACRVKPGQQGMDACLLQGPAAAGRDVSGTDAHGV